MTIEIATSQNNSSARTFGANIGFEASLSKRTTGGTPYYVECNDVTGDLMRSYQRIALKVGGGVTAEQIRAANPTVTDLFPCDMIMIPDAVQKGIAPAPKPKDTPSTDPFLRALEEDMKRSAKRNAKKPPQQKSDAEKLLEIQKIIDEERQRNQYKEAMDRLMKQYKDAIKDINRGGYDSDVFYISTPDSPQKKPKPEPQVIKTNDPKNCGCAN